MNRAANALQPLLIDRLLEVARAQTDALQAGDLEDFDELTNERKSLQQAVQERSSTFAVDYLRRSLLSVAEIDRANLALIESLRGAAAVALGEVRRGMLGLKGYQQMLAPSRLSAPLELNR